MNYIDRFIAYLKSHVGDAYVWGAQGECISAMTDIEEWIRRRETSDTNVKRAMAFVAKALKVKLELYGYDCSGLIAKFLQDSGLRASDISSRGLYSICDKINRADLRCGDLVFRHNGEKIYHVGVYIGDGEVIEAKGRDDGVVLRDINASGSRYWNRYGRLQLLYKTIPAELVPPAVRDLRLASPMMRGDDVKALQTKLAALGYSVGTIDGVYGSKTDVAVRGFQTYAVSVKAGVVDIATRKLLGL